MSQHLKPESLRKRPRILLVDDSSSIRSFFSAALAALKYEILTAENPKVAFELLKTNNVDCILTDLEMPEMTGLEFCIKLKEMPQYSSMPIIVLSMHDQDSKVIECLNAGADDYLLKRTNPEVIVAKIRLMTEVSLARKEMIKLERMKTYQSTIATLNHEWNNLSMILDYFVQKYSGNLQNADEKAKFEKMSQIVMRTVNLIKGMQTVDEIDFEKYSEEGQINLIKLKKTS